MSWKFWIIIFLILIFFIWIFSLKIKEIIKKGKRIFSIKNEKEIENEKDQRSSLVTENNIQTEEYYFKKYMKMRGIEEEDLYEDEDPIQDLKDKYDDLTEEDIIDLYWNKGYKEKSEIENSIRENIKLKEKLNFNFSLDIEESQSLSQAQSLSYFSHKSFKDISEEKTSNLRLSNRNFPKEKIKEIKHNLTKENIKYINENIKKIDETPKLPKHIKKLQDKLERKGIKNICKFESRRNEKGRLLESKGERQCRYELEKIYEVKFRSTRNLDWLRNPLTGYKIELDGYTTKVPQYLKDIGIIGLAFEYHGNQHYIYPHGFHRDLDSFIRQCQRDNDKLDICDKRGVYVISVPYNVRYDLIKDYITYYLPENVLERSKNHKF